MKKTYKQRAFSPWAFAAIIVCGFVFFGCENGNNPTTKKDIPVTDVTLTGDAEFGLLVDETKELTATVSPASANQKVSWFSSAPSVATVSGGVVTAHDVGTAIITVVADDSDGQVKASCTVTVGRIVVTGVTLDETTLNLKVREFQVLTPTVLPETAANKSVSWESSDNSTATVDKGGTVTGVAAGTATITVRTNNNQTASCEVTVRAIPVESVELDKVDLGLGLWASQRLTATVLPPDATNKKVTWSSSRPEIATVTVNPVTGFATVTAVAVGDTTITVTTTDGGETDICAVNVELPIAPEITMVKITADTFTMGSPESEYGHFPYEDDPYTNETQHEVTLTKDFYMGAYQVSQAAYKAVMQTNPSRFNVEGGEYDELLNAWPVDSVNWYEAVEFCNRLSFVEGLDQVYTITNRTPATGYPIRSATVTWDDTKNGFRLPTEAEWEYACRAGTTTAYNTGDTITLDDANFNDWDTGYWYGLTLPWGDFAPNEWDLYSMHGNLEEWCWDWADDYETGTVTDPVGPAYPSPDYWDGRIVRGGSWYDAPVYIRSAARWYYDPGRNDDVIGFRVVRNGDGPAPKATPAKAVSKAAKQALRLLRQKSTRNFDKNSAPSGKLEFLRREGLGE